MKTLILAEKPSVARDISLALSVPLARGTPVYENDQYVITSAPGHLLELAPPETYDPTWKTWCMGVLPMVPVKFQLVPIKNMAAYLSTLKKLLNWKDVSLVVNACDAGREGELIFRYVMRHAGSTKPVNGCLPATRVPPIYPSRGLARRTMPQAPKKSMLVILANPSLRILLAAGVRRWWRFLINMS